MPTQRVHRLIRLITLLQSRRARSARELAEELDVSRRTLFRDLNALEEAGVPYYHEKDVGYRVAGSFYLPPVSLTVLETLGLLLMAEMALGQRRKPLLSSALGAMQKLIATVPAPIRDACEDLTRHVTYEPPPQTAGELEARHYQHLQQAIDQRRACMLGYTSPVDPEPARLPVHPYALHHAGRAWYLFAFSETHDEVRVFKLVRIRSVALLDRKFLRPVGWTVQHKLGSAWQLIPEGRVHDVTVRFTPKVATNVAEVRWHASQKHERLPDGGCRLHFRVDGLAEIAWWICGYADQAIVEAPLTLRDRVATMLHAAAAQYGKAA